MAGLSLLCPVLRPGARGAARRAARAGARPAEKKTKKKKETREKKRKVPFCIHGKTPGEGRSAPLQFGRGSSRPKRKPLFKKGFTAAGGLRETAAGWILAILVPAHLYFSRF